MEYNFKKDFPIFANNSELVYLDNGATTQKPSKVIEGVTEYLENTYSNIHRGAYSLSEKSEEIYFLSKEVVAKFLGGSADEVIYTYNSTYAFNILAFSLARSGYLKEGDKVILSIAEHHANIVPWHILKEEIGIEVEFVNIDDEGCLDMIDFDKKYDEKVKVVALNYVSNVTGNIFPVKLVGKKLSENTLFIVDGSQAVPNFKVDVNELGCDFFIFTGHKVMSHTGIGVLWGRKYLLKDLKPSMGGGGSINDVDTGGFSYAHTPEKFEFGTPNLVGAVSLLKAFEYIQEIGGFDVVREREKELTKYALEKFESLKGEVELIGSYDINSRLGVFSFVLQNEFPAPRVGEKFAEKDVCIRCGGHCAHPLLHFMSCGAVCRMSLYFYNDKDDIDKFFEVLKELL